MTFVHNKFLNVADVKIAATAIRTFADFRTFSSATNFPFEIFRVKTCIVTYNTSYSFVCHDLGPRGCKHSNVMTRYLQRLNETFVVHCHNNGVSMRMMTS